MNKSELLKIIMDELKIICEENEIDSSSLGPETMLFGSGSIIDSLSLVGLVIKIEEYVLEKTGKEIQVIDEDAIITEGDTPFKDAVTLADLVLSKI